MPWPDFLLKKRRDSIGLTVGGTEERATASSKAGPIVGVIRAGGRAERVAERGWQQTI